MDPNKAAEWGKVIIPLLVALGFVKMESGNVKADLSTGVQQARVTDRSNVEHQLRGLNARLYILEQSLEKIAKKRLKQRSLAEYVLSPQEAQILKSDILSAIEDVRAEVSKTPIVD